MHPFYLQQKMCQLIMWIFNASFMASTSLGSKTQLCQNKQNPGIPQFLAYAFAIFTEYTVWAAFGGMSRSALEIYLFITDMQMRYQICPFGDDRPRGFVLVPSTTHIPDVTKICHCVLIREAKVYLFCWQATYIHIYTPSIQTAWQQKSKWFF